MKFGFEVECYYSTDYKTILLPPKEYPHDGMAGLVELRSSGAKSIRDAYMEVLSEYTKYPNLIFLNDHSFSGEQRRELRKRFVEKSPCDIQNLYGHKPRSLGNKTIASLQINISNQTEYSYKDDKGVYHKDRFGLFDVPKIIKKLDEEFKLEIKNSKRQPGEYCIKGDRLEYRSLPNTVFEVNLSKVQKLIERIEKAVY